VLLSLHKELGSVWFNKGEEKKGIIIAYLVNFNFFRMVPENSHLMSKRSLKILIHFRAI
jgi:hypothetical protein